MPHQVREWETLPGNRERFLKFWNAGMPTRQMSAKLDVSLSTLWKIRKRLGLPPRATSPTEASHLRLAGGWQG